MNVLTKIGEVHNATDRARCDGLTVGFVPTMGALHDGHLSLIRRAREECGFVLVSIFVNPAQFGPHEDLDAYPRQIEEDLRLCEETGADAVFAPPSGEIYPATPSTRVVVSGLTESMEGAHRPGHFDGVALVVTKLLSIAGACRAYFGEKDAQQLRVVRRMAADLSLRAEIVACPTVREEDGLAMSSRNAYLSGAERAIAASLPRALETVKALASEGVTNAEKLKAAGRAELDEFDEVDYLSVVDPDTLADVQMVQDRALVCAAVRIGRTRLIDNMEVRVPVAVSGDSGREIQ